MISAKAALIHHGFDIESPVHAIQQVRTQVGDAKRPLDEAAKIIFNIIGATVKFTDVKTALHVTQHIVLTYVTNESYDEELAMSEAMKKANSMRTSKDTEWCFAKPDAATRAGETTASVIDGIETQVAVNKDGSIKKGGKQVLATEMYKKYVLEAEAPITSKAFVAMLVSQVGMSKSGASTYSYNMRTKLGGTFGTA
jgi:hypothetical protein